MVSSLKEINAKRNSLPVIIFFALLLFLGNYPQKKYIVNKYTKKYHRFDCVYGIRIRRDNRTYIRTAASAMALEKKGYRACRFCGGRDNYKIDSGKIMKDSNKNGEEKDNILTEEKNFNNRNLPSKKRNKVE